MDLNSFMKKNRFHIYSIGLISLLIIVVYANTLDNEFTNWDDKKLILNNPSIRSLSMDNLKSIFFPGIGGTYQPMRVFSYAIDYSIGKFDPFVYHVHNMFLHMASSILLYLILLQMLPSIQYGRDQQSFAFLLEKEWVKVISLFSTLLFALHPVNVEAVTWLSSRKYVLLAFFSFASFFFYLKRNSAGQIGFKYYTLFLLFWMFAVMSSPFGVALPGLYLLYEYCAHPDKNPATVLRDNFYRFLPFILIGVLALIYLLVTLSAMTRFKNFASWHIPVTMMQVFFDYMRNFLLPLWLNNRYVDYIYTSIFAHYKIIAGFFLLIFYIAIPIVGVVKRNNKFVFFCLFWFLVSLLPAANIIPIAIRMADRYVYLASVGIFVFFSLSIAYLIARYGSTLKIPQKRHGLIFMLFMSTVVIVISILSVVRNDVWQNSRSLWEDSIEKAQGQGHIIAFNNLGLWHFRKGNLQKAKQLFLASTYVKNTDKMPLHNLGRVYMEEGAWSKAEIVYKKILSIDPKDVHANRNMWETLRKQDREHEAGPYLDVIINVSSSDVVSLNQKGLILWGTKNYKQAEKTFINALMTYPQNPDLHLNLGLVLQDTGRLDAAFERFRKAAELKKDYALAYQKMGQVLYEKSEHKKALQMYEKALTWHLGSAEIYTDMGNAFFAQGLYDSSDQYYTKSIRINPSVFEPVFNRCVGLERVGRAEEAIDCYLDCSERFEDRPEPVNNIGSILFNDDRLEEAEKYYLSALNRDAAFSNARKNIIHLYLKQALATKALEKYTALYSSSDDIGLLHDVCVALGDQGSHDEAEQCLMRLLDRQPENAIANFQLGIVLLRKKRNSEAEHFLKKAVEIDPDNTYFKSLILIEP